MSELTLHLRDRNEAMADAWRRWFRDQAEVEVSCGDIFDGGVADAIVSPANSFGFMDGGIDLVYSRRFGWELQERLQTLIHREKHGELTVGDAVIVETMDEEIPFLVSAPTMRIPMDVSETVNAYLAFRAALIAVERHNQASASEHQIRRLLCPGLCTAVGRMPFERAASQMHEAWCAIRLGQTLQPLTVGHIVDVHRRLLR